MKLKVKEYRYRISFYEYISLFITKRFLAEKNKKYSSERPHRMAVYANDWIGSKIFVEGVYEKEELNILIDILSGIGVDLKNSSALDIGANIGNHSIFLSRYFSKVISIEPNPYTFQILKFNTQFFSNITIYNFGLGDKREQLIMFEDNVNYGATSAVYKSGTASEVNINVETLDEISLDTSDISLIKIDVEGMEYRVLLGSVNFIKKENPIIVMEQHMIEFIPGENDTQATKLLNSLGYKYLWIETKKIKWPWFFRRMKNICEVFTGKKTKRSVFFGDSLPRKDHNMIIAIPRKYFDKACEIAR